jgi:hypothetical protein
LNPLNKLPPLTHTMITVNAQIISMTDSLVIASMAVCVNSIEFPRSSRYEQAHLVAGTPAAVAGVVDRHVMFTNLACVVAQLSIVNRSALRRSKRP